MSDEQATVTPNDEVVAPTEQPQEEQKVEKPPSFLDEVLGDRPPLEEKKEVFEFVQRYMNAKVEDAFQQVATRVKDKADLTIKLKRVFSKDDAKDILVLLLDGLFEAMLFPGADGTNVPTSLGIPGGFGSFQLGYAKKTRAFTPQQEWVDVPRRWRVKYIPGKKVVDRVKALIPPPPEPEETPVAPEENSGNPSTG